MSLMSFLAFAPAIASRYQKPDVEITRLRQELAEAKAEVERALARNEQLVIERDRARMRLDQQSRMLEGWMQARLNGQECVCAFRHLYAAQNAQLAQQQQYNAQQNALMAQYHQTQAAQNAFANPFAEIVDCTGGGRARYLLHRRGSIPPERDGNCA